MADVLELESIERRFGSRAVLRGLSFQVERGSVHALVGRNGAGKTTALRILLGFLAPHGGRARLLGCDTRALAPAVRERVGVVAEGHRLFEGMRVRALLDFEAATRARFRRDRAEGAVRRAGLGLDARVRELSAGQRAELALLLALASDPELLVLDDPAAGLDAVVRRGFLEATIDLLGEEGRSVLFSSHVLADVERLADRVTILHGGRAVVDATLDDLRRRVARRFLRFEGDAPADVPRLAGVLRARRERGGWDVLTVDWGEPETARARALGARISEPIVPSLEELFVELTSGGRGASPTDAGADAPSRAAGAEREAVA